MEGGFELTQTVKSVLAALDKLLGIWRWRRGWRVGCGGDGWAQAHLADLKILLEAIRLEKVGEFECSNVAALGADFALEVKDDGAKIIE